MSAIVKVNQSTKPFCKVCFDSGKSEEIYTSHYVRISKEDNARTACPTLLELSCKFCNKNGHTIKYCQIKIKEDKKENYKQIEKERMIVRKPIKKSRKNNSFNALCESSDDEEEINQKRIEKKQLEMFPALTLSSTKKEVNSVKPAISYKSVIAKTYKDLEDERLRKEEEKIFSILKEKKIIKDRPAVMEAPLQIQQAPRKYVNWADYESSDEENEEEEEDEHIRNYRLRLELELELENEDF